MIVIFVTFEGIDGSGLSTQAALLNDYFIKNGMQCVLTKEPTNNIIGGIIRAGLRDEWKTSNLTIQNLFAADRSHHLATEIEPALKKRQHVICDRYILSTIAFGALDVPIDYLKQINSLFRKPDITFIIDVHPAVSLERMKKARYHVEMFETEQRLTQIRQNYLALKNFFPTTFIIDGNNTIEQVQKDIIKAIRTK
ncbi:MAG: dTMP kinase [Candidatus Aenigmarchaeota archaeon]|nr:dTMP kinase [Candidatus Aenigmarchaeota archaeon]